MTLRHTTPLRYKCSTLSDTIDSTENTEGTMAALKNLIPDPSTLNVWQCRPAAISQTTFGSFTTPAFISCMVVKGTRVYGMIASGRNVGNDEPFCYDLVGGTFVAISGITGLSTPASPNPTGAWTPPTMDVVGTKVIITHPGFTGAGGNFFGWIETSAPNALTWSAGNTSPTALAAVPTFVKQFNGRAYFIVNPATGTPGLYASDILAATTITNANQILTFGDNVALTALGALPLSNQLGGIIQSLIVFKGSANMFQVTGDFVGNTWAVNALNIATGTLAPLSITATPLGLIFVSPEGVRYIDFDARVSKPLGSSGEGVTVPFISAGIPSRIVAASNADVIRITTQNLSDPAQGRFEYWYDISRERWTGPHSFPASLIQPYSGTFIVAPYLVNANLFQSDVVQSSASTYTENGTALQWQYETPMLPDIGQMEELGMLETTVKIAYASGQPEFILTAQDQNGSIFDTVTLQASGASTIWGAFNWGAPAIWQGATNALLDRPINWHLPIVFKRLQLNLQGASASQIKLGDWFLRYEQLGYLEQVAA